MSVSGAGEQSSPNTQNEVRSGLSLSTVAGLVTAGVAIVGALWFGLLSWGAAIAYEPAGVAPREIGLSSGTVLTQAGIGLVGWVTLFLLYVGVAALAGFIVRRNRPGGEDLRATRRNKQRLFIGLSVVYLLIGVVGITAWEAVDARRALADGRRPSAGWLTLGTMNPWGGQIAVFAWAAKPPAGAPSLPKCALYLGESGGTAVVYSASDSRTWRLPSSALAVRAEPGRDSC